MNHIVQHTKSNTAPDTKSKQQTLNPKPSSNPRP